MLTNFVMKSNLSLKPEKIYLDILLKGLNLVGEAPP